MKLVERRRAALIALVLLLAAAPPVATLLGQPFYVDLLRRVDDFRASRRSAWI